MFFLDLAGSPTSGDAYAAGPKSQTVWVSEHGTGRWVVVKPQANPTKKTPEPAPAQEVEYQTPAPVAGPSPEHVAAARTVLAEKHAILTEFRKAGIRAEVVDFDYLAAKTILDAYEDSQRARTPFLRGRGGQAAVSDKRLCELARDNHSREEGTDHEPDS